MMHGRGALMMARDMGRLGARMRDMRAGPAAAAISTAAAIGIISAAAGHSTHHRARHGAGHRIPLRESPLGPRDRRDEHGEKNGRQRPPPSAWSALVVGEIVPIVWRSIQGHRAPPIKRNLYINNYSLLPGGCQCAPPNSSEVSSGEALPYRSTQAPAQRSPPDSIARVREKHRRLNAEKRKCSCQRARPAAPIWRARLGLERSSTSRSPSSPGRSSETL